MSKLRLFDTQIARKPNLYPWTDDFINAMWHGFWTPNEFDFKSDKQDFKRTLTEVERRIIVRNLTSIGQIEIAVKTFWALLGTHFPHPSMSDLGYVLANTEVIHNKAYEKLLDVLGLAKAFEENLKVPVVQGRVQYLRKHLEPSFASDRKQYIYSIILFTLFVENVSLFSQFYTILWFKRNKNVLRDTAQQVAYTRNEEKLHAEVGIKLINTLRSEYPEYFDEELENKIYKECYDAFDHEGNIIDWILDGYEAEGLSSEILRTFIKNRFNDSLKSAGFKKIFEVDEAVLDKTYWMDEETIGNNMVDFFHARPVDYAKKNRSFNEDELF